VGLVRLLELINDLSGIIKTDYRQQIVFLHCHQNRLQSMLHKIDSG
jgi:hypothetical protein